MPPTIITGEVHFEPGAPPFAGATVRVRLEDVSLADAKARVLAEEALPGVSRQTPETAPIPFTLQPRSALRPSGTYTVRAHVDLNSNDSIDEGDFITTQRFPVRVGPGPVHVAVTVSRYGGV
jgi:putative lipoprotein